MNNGSKLYHAFGQIQAEEALKEKTMDYLQEELRNKRMVKRRHRFRMATICSTFVLLLFFSGYSYQLYFTPVTYIDIDINPSLEIALNRFDRVIITRAYNEDGMAVLENINIKNKSYHEAMQFILEDTIEQGYLVQEGLVSVTVQAKDVHKQDNTLQGVQATVDFCLNAHHATVQTDIFAVSREIRQTAEEYSLSPAKYIAITKLQEVDATVTYDACRDHTISEIHGMAVEQGAARHGQMDANSSSGNQKDTKDTDGPGGHKGHHGNGRQ